MALFVWNVTWPGEGVEPASAVAEVLGVDPGAIAGVRLLKKSLDARRRRQAWRATYRVDVADEEAILAAAPPSVRAWTDRDALRYGDVDPSPIARVWPADVRPIVVGMGPAGLFCALVLAEAGASVVLLERGEPVEARVDTVNGHWRGKLPLDPESNVVFGEGGAGTFSDGKIYTRRRDGDLGYIFRRLADFGADPVVLQDAWAHLGTDKVRAILPRFRARLIELGVDLRFGTRVDDLIVHDGRAIGVVLGDGSELRGGPVVVATGHSARDATEMMIRAGAAASARPIAIGARIEHPQSLVDEAQYHGPRGDLPPASYRLTSSPDSERKVHTFCMCPGGMVVPASNHLDRIVVNGMSFAARRSFWANSAVVVEVRVTDYEHSDPLAGYAYQDRIERLCAELGGGGDVAPGQRVVDFVAGRPSSDLPRVSYPRGAAPADLTTVLPAPVVAGMQRAMGAFAESIPGFAGDLGVLIAPETRTTSPVRLIRTETGESTTVRDLYPSGEGAGYGGGIISCALDGYRIGRALLEAHPTR